MMKGLHVCFFETPLSELKGAAARDPIVVYDTILAQGGRFSAFDVNGVLAKPLSMLFERYYLIDDHKQGYPYTRCAATEKGIAWREGRLCAQCSGEGFTLRKLNRRNSIAKPCAACAATGITPPNPNEQETR